MDVKADQAGLEADPFVTAVVRRPDTSEQGQLFSDAYPTYAKTDQIPAVGGGGRGGSRPRTSRLLKVAVVVVALAVVAGGVALGLVKGGVIDNNNSSGNSNGNGRASTSATTHQVAPPTSKTAPVVTQVSTGSGTATYTVAVPAYAVTVTTSTGRSWVSIGGSGQHPAFAGILGPNSSKRAILLGPAEVDIGAGGTKLTVTAGKKSTTLTPPAAPFTYQFQLKRS